MRLRSALPAATLALALGVPAVLTFPQPSTFVGVTAACDDGQWTDVTIRLEHSTDGHTWAWLEDKGDGTTAAGGGIEIHAVNGRYQPGGKWLKVETLSGGEGHLRFNSLAPMSSGDVWDLIRVTYDGWTSAPAPGDSLNCGGQS